MQSVKRTVEKSRYLALITQPSASRTYVLSPFIPAVNCWATVIRPLSRTERTTFCAKQLPAATRGLFQPKIVFALSPASFAQRVTQHSFSPPLRKRREGWGERLLARNPTPNPSPFYREGHIQKAEWVFLCKAVFDTRSMVSHSFAQKLNEVLRFFISCFSLPRWGRVGVGVLGASSPSPLHLSHWERGKRRH
jgi:hypothetical protein